uniref:Uncharacterized protein n=1 Tax=Mycena chlorophos TaxID=658473 RepID=A0ABQ0LBG3_MYCCL|nr:predicted protein [Mycena chlorophos]
MDSPQTSMSPSTTPNPERPKRTTTWSKTSSKTSMTVRHYSEFNEKRHPQLVLERGELAVDQFQRAVKVRFTKIRPDKDRTIVRDEKTGRVIRVTDRYYDSSFLIHHVWPRSISSPNMSGRFKSKQRKDGGI